jgi:hypothetical protein
MEASDVLERHGFSRSPCVRAMRIMAGRLGIGHQLSRAAALDQVERERLVEMVARWLHVFQVAR